MTWIEMIWNDVRHWLLQLTRCSVNFSATYRGRACPWELQLKTTFYWLHWQHLTRLIRGRCSVDIMLSTLTLGVLHNLSTIPTPTDHNVSKWAQVFPPRERRPSTPRCCSGCDPAAPLRTLGGTQKHRSLGSGAFIAAATITVNNRNAVG